MKLPFVQVDAFAGRPFDGNPAAVMHLDAWPADTVLQAIAAENNLSETAFLVRDASATADFELRWFTPGAEVALCGHATLASGHVVLGGTGRDRVTFATRQAGVLSVEREGREYALTLPIWRATPKPLPELVAALGIARSVETLWNEHGYGVVVVEDEAVVRALVPDLRALLGCGPVVAIVTAPGIATDIVSRVFTPYYRIDEDPVTGSAHAVIVPYWTQRLGQTTLTAEQGGARRGQLKCRLAGDHVVLTGACTTVIEGWFDLPA